MAKGNWIYERGTTTGSGGGGTAPIPGAPPVTIVPPADVIFRSNSTAEIDIDWLANGAATPTNFTGVKIYLEDPDISSGKNGAMDGSAVTLDASAQMSGDWAPTPVGESTKSPAVVLLDSTKTARDIRIYLAAYGPHTQAKLVRATDPSPTPSIVVHVEQGTGPGETGMEYAFLVTDPEVTVTPDYARPDPNYILTFSYTPPDSDTPIPPNLGQFAGAHILYVDTDPDGSNPQIANHRDSYIDIPVSQSDAGFASPIYTPGAGGGAFRCYFCSESDLLGSHINSLVEGVTPYALAIVPPPPGSPGVPSAPSVIGLTISDKKIVHMIDGSFYAEATFSWDLPDDPRYAGVFLYLVDVTGTPPLTNFPMALTSQQSNMDAGLILDIPNGMGAVIPGAIETWTIAVISVDVNGNLAYDPSAFGADDFAPTVTWDVGPPVPGSQGSGEEYAPVVTLAPGATATAHESTSNDGVRMVSFDVGSWINPDDNKFSNVEIAMVVNNDPTKPQTWMVPANATDFTTPAIPAPGNFGSTVPIDFYLLSVDPQGNVNELLTAGTTPKIHLNYNPTEGEIIPARDGWFSDEFAWPAGGEFQADSFAAEKIYVGDQLIVGGAGFSSFDGPNGHNGQIAALRADGVMVAWMGQSEPNLGAGQGPAGVYGGWFGNLYVGGSNPLDAPIFVDGNGVIQVGGIAAAQGSSRYPYMSVRDQHGVEMGRIGAQITSTRDGTGNVGGSPPAGLTAGAWFTQLAVGGSSLTNWNILIIPDTSNPPDPLGSQFLMRNIRHLQVAYAASAVQPFNPAYALEFGNQVWIGQGVIGSTYQFPGIHIYESVGTGSPPSGGGFGSTFLNRGVVLQGTANQGYVVLASFVTYNGDPTGADAGTGPSPNRFWGELAMYSPNSPYNRTVYLASGGASTGSPTFYLRDQNSNVLFQVDNLGTVTCPGSIYAGEFGAWNGGSIIAGTTANVVIGTVTLRFQNGLFTGYSSLLDKEEQ